MATSIFVPLVATKEYTHDAPALIRKVAGYDPATNPAKLQEAYDYAKEMHQTQARANGEPYFTHLEAVADILADMRLDWQSVAVGLLHDVLEDTTATPEEIEKRFGPDILRMIDGVTKLSRIALPEKAGEQVKQAENFRKLVIAMSEDIRVLLVKLADRLHNMRTLHFIEKPEKRRRIARETMEIYAPLAERIGVSSIKEELQDLSFIHLHPEVRESITTRLAFLKQEGDNIVPEVIAELKQKLAEAGLENVDIKGREKRPYSIWRKMEKLNVGFEQLSDIMAFRVIVKDVEECYKALGVIHGQYRSVPNLFDDYISNPKPNGYASLHTTVIGPLQRRIEMQIRTQDMHDVAERGVAAHWSYKQGSGNADGKQYRWLRELLEILDSAQKPEEFLEHTKLELFQDQVFCFTPKGELISLPRGATPVDFAYAVHSDVGDHCAGAKVNGRIVPLNHQLDNGDQLEIITAKRQTPSPTWERFVITGKARAHIRRFIRLQQRGEYAQLGKAMLQKVYQQENAEFSEKQVISVVKKLKRENEEDLYAAIGAGLTSARDVFFTIFPGLQRSQADTAREAGTVPIKRSTKVSGQGSGIPIVGLIPGMAVHYARCCHPVAGDRIIGIITTGKGVTVHTIDCETLESFADAPERWLDLTWDNALISPESLNARITAQISNETGSLSQYTTIIAKQEGNITNIKVTNRTPDVMELLTDIRVNNRDHLANILTALRSSKAVYHADRMKGR